MKVDLKGKVAVVTGGGGILCSFISAPLAWFVGVRGIFVASGVILLIMIPMLIPAMKAYQKGQEIMAAKADSEQ